MKAATHILVKQGWQGFTTNHVAEQAGVNIASLYQYFPNKESIVVELQRRHVRAVFDRFPDVKAVNQRANAREILTRVVRAGVDEHRTDPALHRVFVEELPRSIRRAQGELEQAATARWRELLDPLLQNVPDPELATLFSRVSVRAIVHEAAAEQPALLDNPEFVSELVTLLERYLVRSKSARKRRAG